MVLTKVSHTFTCHWKGGYNFCLLAVQFQINYHIIPHGPAISVSYVSIQKRKYFASYRPILMFVV